MKLTNRINLMVETRESLSKIDDQLRKNKMVQKVTGSVSQVTAQVKEKDVEAFKKSWDSDMQKLHKGFPMTKDGIVAFVFSGEEASRIDYYAGWKRY